MLSATAAAAARQQGLVVADAPVTAEDMQGRHGARGYGSSRAVSWQAPSGKHIRAPDVNRTVVNDRPFEECIRLASNNSAARALEVLQEAVLHGFQPDRVTAEKLVKTLASRSLPSGLEAVGKLPLDSCKNYAVLLRCCEARRSLQGIKQVIKAMLTAAKQHGAPRMQTTALIVAFQSLARAGEAKTAEEVFQWHLQRLKGEVPQVLGNAFLNALASDSELAFKWYSVLQERGFAASLVTYNTLLKACMRSGDAARAATIAADIRSNHLQGDEYTYNTLIKVFSYAGDTNAALQVKQEMQAAGFQPSLSIWGSLIVACGRAGLLESAFSFWAEMQAGGVRPNTDCLNALMNACADGYQGDRAIALLCDMQAQGLQPDLVSYNVAVKACGSPPGIRLSRQQLDLGFSLLEEMHNRGLTPDPQTYTSLFTLCAQAAEGRRALATYEALVAEGAKLDVKCYTALISALGSEGLIDEALAVFQRMVWGPARMKPTRQTYRIVTRLCREAGRLEKALEVYRGMRARKFKPSNAEFRELTSACAEQALKEGQSSALPSKMKDVLGISHSCQLDLHGLSEVEARAAVLCGLLASQLEHEAGNAVTSDFVIITGSGLHSEPTEGPKLRNAVLNLLCNELHLLPDACIAESTAGADDGAVDGAEQSKCVDPEERHFVNPGRVIIPRRVLIQWLSNRSGARQSY